MNLSDFAARNLWPAPAKINLFLHVVGKRPDGYHNLQTVFQFLQYGDDLSFEINASGQISRGYDLGFDEETDLCLSAAKLLQRQTGATQGARIDLIKRLPMGGGLGGGSSNAATVLIALNHLWNTRLSRRELATLALELGADVPVFVYGEAAWAEGIGEQLSAIKLDPAWVLVLTPKIEVSTAKVFANKHLTPRREMKKIRALREADQYQFGENQLEPLVRAEYPDVDHLCRWLQQCGSPRMCGSGGSVFLPLPDAQTGQELLNTRPADVTGFVAQSINRHPLYQIDR